MSALYEGDNYELHRANALALPIADSTVDLVVTSPPYFGLRSYQDGGEHYEGQIGSEARPNEFISALIAATLEMMRVLKPTGSIWVNLGDKYSRGRMSADGKVYGDPKYKVRDVRAQGPEDTGIAAKSLIGIPWRYAIRCIDDLGLILRAEVIWNKPNGLPESVTDRVRRSHEHWFHFTKSERYFSAVDHVREPYTAPPFRGQKKHKAGDEKVTNNPVLASVTSWDASNYTGNPLGKLPGSVWTIPSEPLIVPDELGVNHFAAFPSEWPKRIITGWCPDAGVVLDPFCGTGTTVAVARALGRHGIGTDLSADYLRLAHWRVAGDGYRRIVTKVTGRKQSPKTPDSDTPSLFDDTAA